MSDDAGDGQEKRKRSSSLIPSVWNNPALQLKRSLAAQRVLMRPMLKVPDTSIGLEPASVRVFRDMKKQIALKKTIQESIRSDLANAALAMRTANNRILAEAHAVAAARASVALPLRQPIKSVSALRQVVSGSMLTEIRAVLAERKAFVSQFSTHLNEVEKARNLFYQDVVLSIRAAAAARKGILEQMDAVRKATSAFRIPELPKFQGIETRLSGLHLDKLRQVAEQLATSDAVFASWTTETESALVDEIEADIAARPEVAEGSIEDQLNYLIEWTQRQDDASRRQIMLAVLVGLIANFIFWMSIEVIPSLLREAETTQPNVIIRIVREYVEEQPLPSEDLSHLRIVSNRVAPVRATRRRRSQRLGTLEAGTLVRAHEKRRKWVFIEWTDFKTGDGCHGWMLSKHLVAAKK